MNMHSNFFEIAFRHGCSLVNLLHIFITPFLKNTEFKQISELIFPLKSSENLRPSDNFRVEQKLINSLNIRSEI